MSCLKHIGLGLRREIIDGLLTLEKNQPAFVELAPENWMEIGGYWKKKLKEIAEKYPIYSHGLSLSIGSPDDLDIEFIRKIKIFLDEFDIKIYSEHLSYSKTENAQLYDLLPIPFREDVIQHIIMRIKIVQDILERPLILENISYYTSVAAEMDEAIFIREIVLGSSCGLLLDINNIYVNGFNHKYNCKEFLLKLPLQAIQYLHMAGHEKICDDLIIDTHDKPIIPDVLELYEWTLGKIEPVPILLERDFNIPALDELVDEMCTLEYIAKPLFKSYASI